jgi:Kef-type K+ transport system membrane component KefB
MHIEDFFLQFLCVLLAARVLGELAARFRIPPVIGELAAGVLLGPSLLGWLAPDDTMKLLAEIGILLLLFEVGVETDVARLARTGIKPFLVAAFGFLAPFVFGFALAQFVFKLPLLVSLFIGGTLTATSIGITVRVLVDLGKQQSDEAQVVLGAAVIDDILGVILLALLYDFSSGDGITAKSTLQVVGLIAIFLVTAPFLARLIVAVVRRFEDRSAIPGLLPACMVAMLLFFGWLAHKLGAPHLLGGFAAGLAVSPVFYLPGGAMMRPDESFAHRVEKQMKPIVHIFTPVFFVMVGLSLNLREVDWSSGYVWALSGSILLAAVAGKLFSAFIVPGENLRNRLAIGFGMIPRGEVGLIFAELGRTSGVFNADTYAAMLIVIALTTLVPPFLLRALYARTPSPPSPSNSPSPPSSSIPPPPSSSPPASPLPPSHNS